MDHDELYRLLELPEEVTYALNTYGKSKKDSFHIKLNDLMKNTELIQNLDKLIADYVGDDPDGIKILWEELNIALQSYEIYLQKKIPTDIYIDTMKFCSRFLSEYHKTYGCYRFVWGWWFPRQLSLREFRLGALEYELNDANTISIHIPSDADLSPHAVSQSLSRFKDFCCQYYSEWNHLEVQCESWLLSPELKHVLSSGSNILAFQKLFTVAETDYESMAVLDWVFPGFDKVSESLPEETALQKNMKQYLLAGKKIGWSKGILSHLPYV